MADRQVPRTVDKPWGYELIWADTEHYVGKILHVDAGHSLSLQYHEQKDETMHVLRGRMKLVIGPAADNLREVDVGPGESVRIRAGTVHRVVALTDVDILEASSAHIDDIVRLEDKYGRG